MELVALRVLEFADTGDCPIELGDTFTIQG